MLGRRDTDDGLDLESFGARGSGEGSEEGLRRPESRYELLRRLEPRLRELFRRHGVPPGKAEELMAEGLLALGAREEMADREGWLLESVRRRCESVVREQLQAAEGSIH